MSGQLGVKISFVGEAAPAAAAKRIQIPESISLEELLHLLLARAPGGPPREEGAFVLQYEDEEGDLISCDDEQEWEEAKRIFRTFLKEPFHLLAQWVPAQEHQQQEHQQPQCFRGHRRFFLPKLGTAIHHMLGKLSSVFPRRNCGGAFRCGGGATPCEQPAEESEGPWKVLQELGLDGDLARDLKEQMSGSAEDIVQRVVRMFHMGQQGDQEEKQEEEEEGAGEASSSSSSSSSSAGAPAEAENEKEGVSPEPQPLPEPLPQQPEKEQEQASEEGEEEEDAKLVELFHMFDGLGVSRELVRFMVRERNGDLGAAASDILEVIRSARR